MKKFEELKAALRIDKMNLDEEAINQPMLYMEVSEMYVQRAADRDALKENLAVVDAALDKELRVKMTKDLEKFTEAMVKAAIQGHKKHVAAFEAYSDAKEQSDFLAALKESFQQRKSMLQELVSLHISNYFERSVVNTQYDDQRAKMSDRRKRQRIEE